MTNIVDLFGLLVKLLPFLKEVFIKNKDFREAIIHNRAVLGVFLACIVLFTINLDHLDTLMDDQEKIRELKRGFEVVEADHRELTEELSAIRIEVVELKQQNHQYEVDLTEAKKTIQLREESILEYKNTINILRRRLGYKTE